MPRATLFPTALLRVPRFCMPPARVHRNACTGPGLTTWESPTTTVPSPDTALAWLCAPPSVPRFTMPADVHRKARSAPPGVDSLEPTTTEPSAEMPEAQLYLPVPSTPRLTIPPAAV